MPTLKELRRRAMLTQKDLAELVGVKYQTVQYWEAGFSEPRPATMRKLLGALGVTADQLFDALDETKAIAKKVAA